MKLPAAAHTSHPWWIHELAPDFRIEDVWALPTPGGPDGLDRLLARFTSAPFPEGAPLLVRALWAARWRIGARLGWDGPGTGLGTRVASLRDRIPQELRRDLCGPDLPVPPPFTPVYRRGDEYAAELANTTVHTIMHLGWVPDGTGGYRGQMAVLTKPNGFLGAAYMAAIAPFRSLLVYPALLRAIERGWHSSEPGAAPR